MPIPLRITFRGMPPSKAIEAKIEERANDLQTFESRISNCHVVVVAPHRHQKKGFQYHVRIDLKVPGEEIVVNRVPTERGAQSDVFVAIRDAFDAARRKLEDHSRVRRGEVKTHAAVSHGQVVLVDPIDGYGFLETADGLRVYFHENAIVGAGLDDLAPGREVRFELAEGEGVKGPQASSVLLVGKHHVVP
jgi:cold shock CspA family protein